LGTPFKRDILERAKEIDLERKVRQGLPALTAEEVELKESGAFYEAQAELMGQDASISAEQERYIRDMADEMNLEVVPKKEYRHFLKWQLTPEKPKPKGKPSTFWKARALRFFLKTPKPEKKVLPIIDLTRKKRKETFKKAPTPKALEVILNVPRKKKRPKRHIQRNGKTMRKLKHVKNVKVFSFPDEIWKVRRKRK